MSHGQVVSPANRSEKLSKEAYLKIDQQHIFESELKQDMDRLINCDVNITLLFLIYLGILCSRVL